MNKRGVSPNVDIASENSVRNEKFQNLLNSVKRNDEIVRSLKKKRKPEDMLHDPLTFRSGLGTVNRFLGNFSSFEFSEEDTIAIEGFTSGNHSGTATMNAASAARLSSCSTKSDTAKFLNDELINMFSGLVVEMDCELICESSVSVGTRIGYFNTTFMYIL